MTREMLIDIMILSAPAFLMVLLSTRLEVKISAMILTASMFSNLPQIISDNFNYKFAVLYGILVGAASYLTSMVVT
jgi:hypothetical protein